ncbi:hypothetical protein [Trinickia mobilis]|uniref:hypothetical protein n=1 Tax=Trinickia mobilis TaxID=2816356 RepID=UPI001A8E3BCA|nr:hypothetical protein [Trinickia mobilis]
MSILLGVAKSNPTRYSLVAVAAISLAAVCGIGIAAFAGLLPASGGVAVAVTATPLIDMQVDASVNAGRNHGLSSRCHALRHEAP